MLLVGFPTFGLVGSIAASYLTNSLGMKPFGYIAMDELPPTVVMDDGLVMAPIRLYTTQTVCGIDGKCNQLVVIMSDIQPPLESLTALSRTILDWVEENTVSSTIVLEGHPSKEETDGEPVVVAMANKSGAGIFEKYNLNRANGMITGFTGAMLLESIGRKAPVVCFVAQAHKEYPDANAAAVLLEAVNPLVPLLVIDTKPLRVKAAQIEAEMRRNMDTQKSSIQKLSPEHGGEMYR